MEEGGEGGDIVGAGSLHVIDDVGEVCMVVVVVVVVVMDGGGLVGG